MKAIKPKFDVGDKIRHKHNSNNKQWTLEFLIIQVDTATCIAGTQIMYNCRLLITKYIKEFPTKDSYTYKEVSHDRNLQVFHEFEIEKA